MRLSGIFNACRQNRLPGLFLAAVALVVLAPPARAAEISAFASGGNPAESWSFGYGGSVGITVLNLVGIELEGAWQGGQTATSEMWSASARAYVGPSFRQFVPYAGLSTGIYRQTRNGDHDFGSMNGLFVGLKFKLPLGVVLKGEYQWVHLPEEALVPMTGRYYGGAALTF